MIENKPENPHAFPSSVDQSRGITLRDYFAAKAMQGWLANTNVISAKELMRVDNWRKDLSEGSYLLADEMLKAREA